MSSAGIPPRSVMQRRADGSGRSKNVDHNTRVPRRRRSDVVGSEGQSTLILRRVGRFRLRSCGSRRELVSMFPSRNQVANHPRQEGIVVVTPSRMKNRVPAETSRASARSRPSRSASRERVVNGGRGSRRKRGCRLAAGAARRMIGVINPGLGWKFRWGPRRERTSMSTLGGHFTMSMAHPPRPESAP